jgi:hypothetical protein
LELNTKMTTRYMDPVPQSRRLLPPLAVLATFALVSWLAGCSVLVDANRAQCSTDADCTSKGAQFANYVCKAGLCEGAEADARFSCNATPPPDAPSYKLTMHLQDAVSMAPLPGIDAQLCRKLDLTCDSPIDMTVADANGVVTMQIEAGFSGYVQLTGSKIAPSLYFLTPPTSGDLDLPTVPLTSPFVAGGIVQTAGGTTWNKERGIVLLNAFDCDGKGAANITYSIGGAPDANTFIFYLVNALPTTAVTITDDTGYGGLVNVPPGVTTVSALLEPSGRKVSSISVLVRAGFVTYSSVTPNSL